MSYIHTPHYDRGMDGHLSIFIFFMIKYIFLSLDYP
nr:MAG TPA: hypothetical protein [Caudoviricetes sp.]